MSSTPNIQTIVLEALPYAVLLLDQDGLIQFANQPAAHFLQKTPEELHGYHIHDIVADSILLIPEKPTKYWLNGRLVVIRSSLLNESQGNPYPNGLLLTFTDCTTEYHALFEAAAYMSTVAVEFRSLLTPVRSYLESMLLGVVGPLSVKQQEWIELPRQNTLRMIALADDLLEVGRLRSAKKHHKVEQLQLQPFIEDVRLDLAGQFGRRSISLNMHYVQPPASLQVDPRRLKLILLKLLDNAGRYTEPGGMVSVTVTGHPDAVQFDIQDTGVGIKAAEQPFIFQPFFRGSAGTKPGQNGGSGLSLFLVQGCVELHGGTIWFRSTEGIGTTFSFVLPTRTEAEQD
jgi:signal transduction histidine kinase